MLNLLLLLLLLCFLVVEKCAYHEKSLLGLIVGSRDGKVVS